MGPLLAVCSWAEAAIDTNFRDCPRCTDINFGAIDGLLRVLRRATDRHGKALVFCRKPNGRALHSPVDREITAVIRHLDNLSHDAPWNAKTVMHIEPGTRAAVAGQLNGRDVEPFGDVAATINAQKEERNSPLSGALQRGQAVANLLVGNGKTGRKEINVIARQFRPGIGAVKKEWIAIAMDADQLRKINAASPANFAVVGRR